MGKQKIQTKRNERNKYKWEQSVNYAKRMLNRNEYFKWKGRGE